MTAQQLTYHVRYVQDRRYLQRVCDALNAYAEWAYGSNAVLYQ